MHVSDGVGLPHHGQLRREMDGADGEQGQLQLRQGPERAGRLARWPAEPGAGQNPKARPFSTQRSGSLRLTWLTRCRA